MKIIFASRDLPFTEQIKEFITNRLSKLQKYSSSLSNIQVILDVDRNKRGTTQDAIVELIGNLKGRRITVRESAETFYKAFFGATAKMKRLLVKKKS